VYRYFIVFSPAPAIEGENRPAEETPGPEKAKVPGIPEISFAWVIKSAPASKQISGTAENSTFGVP